MALKLLAGYAWNPIRDWPRNAQCICGSGKKFKKCHAPKIPMVCKADEVKDLRLLVNLVKDGNEVKLKLADPITAKDQGNTFELQVMPKVIE